MLLFAKKTRRACRARQAHGQGAAETLQLVVPAGSSRPEILIGKVRMLFTQ